MESTNSKTTVLLAQAMETATTVRLSVVIVVIMFGMLVSGPRSFATTKGLSQIVTPDLESPGDLSSEFPNPGQADCEPLSIASRAGPH